MEGVPFASLPGFDGLMKKYLLVCVTAAMLVILDSTLVQADDASGRSIKVLLIDGQNNHKWQETSPLIQQTLEGASVNGINRFDVDVATSPPKGGDMSTFDPTFAGYDVVVSNYNGEPWSDKTQQAFEKFVAGGGGFVSVHAADNSFPKWTAYNRMIGLGGWGGRNEADGPYVRWKEDMQKFTRDTSPGKGGCAWKTCSVYGRRS